MIKHTFKWSIWIVGIFLVVNVALALITNVPTHVTESDKAVFRTTLSLKKPEGPLTYEQEIALIRSVQKLIFEQVPIGEPIADYETREPEDLFNQKSGLCYDRSRTYDKVFSWLGFEARHVYILYPEHPATGEMLSFWGAFFTKGTNSHAVTEVKTSRGWLLVDSNSAWVSDGKDGLPVDADQLRAKASLLPGMPGYFMRPFWAIRGMYSRRGQLYRPYIPYPQLSWPDFSAWVLER